MKTATGLRGRTAVNEMRRRKHDAEYRQVISNEMIREQFERMIGAFQSGEPGVMLGTFQSTILNVVQAMTQSNGPNLPDDPKTMARHELMHSAYDLYIGTFVERLPRGGFVVWDFPQLLSEAIKVSYDPESKTAMIEAHMDQTEISGAALDPFLRYLHYMGVFMVADARKPCPDCIPGPPRDCESCGGLGWVIPDSQGSSIPGE